MHDETEKRLGEMPTKLVDGLPVEESFFFAVGAGGLYYIVLDSPAYDFVGEIKDISNITLLDASGPITLGLALEASTASRLLETARSRGSKWELRSGEGVVCTGELGDPLYITQVQPHFGAEQQWQEEPETSPANSAETRSTLLGPGFVGVPVLGCRGEPDPTIWARPVGGPALRIAGPVALSSEESALLLEKSVVELRWAESRQRVLDAYKTIDSAYPPEESQAVQRFVLAAEGEAPGMELTEVNLVVGETMCGQGPDAEESTLFWVSCDLGICPVGEAEGSAMQGRRTTCMRSFGDFNGDGSMELLMVMDDLLRTRTLFTIEDGVLVPVKSISINYQDCPC